MDLFAGFLSFPTAASFVSRVLLIGRRLVDRDWEWFFLDETLVFLVFLSSFLRIMKQSSKLLSSVFIFFFVFELPFYLSLFLLPERGDNLSLKGLEMCLIEGIMVLEATDGMVSLERGDLISSESLCFGVLGCGDLETDGLGPLYLMVGDYFLLFLLLLFFFLDLLFFRSGSMSENLLSLSDYLLPLVIRTIVLPGFEICEEMASSCSLSSIDAS